MMTLKVGMFPGTLVEVAVATGTKVSDILGMANITVGAEQEIKLDGETVSPTDVVTSGNLLVVTKRIKGN